MAIAIRFGGYQGDKSVHTRGARFFGEALTRILGNKVDMTFLQNIVEDGNKASDLLSMTESGAIDGCYFSSSYLAGRVPELALLHFSTNISPFPTGVGPMAYSMALLGGAWQRKLRPKLVTLCLAIGTMGCVRSRRSARRCEHLRIALG